MNIFSWPMSIAPYPGSIFSIIVSLLFFTWVVFADAPGGAMEGNPTKREDQGLRRKRRYPASPNNQSQYARTSLRSGHYCTKREPATLRVNARLCPVLAQLSIPLREFDVSE